jgi:dynein heavy chain
MLQQNQWKIQLESFEDKILHSLANAEGEVTQNVNLIVDVETAKTTADGLARQIETALEKEKAMDGLRAKYLPVASRGSLLFFILSNLHKLHSCYVFSLNAFVVMFERGVDTKPRPSTHGLQTPPHGPSINHRKPRSAAQSQRSKAAAKRVILSTRFSWHEDLLLADRVLESSPNLEIVDDAIGASADEEDDIVEDDAMIEARANALQTSITEVIFDYVRRGLFEKHKLVVAAQLCFAILKEEQKLSSIELNFVRFDKLIQSFCNLNMDE